ncbi:MAG: LptF/LptG family permease [Tidjanibacter sp.]|nr:LptF/LptG family permease [Tidjanibacter sp.]
MKTIHKFTLKAFLGPMVLSFFIVMFILMMNFVWRYIDELVGKGLSFDVIVELLFYATANMMPLGIPLATLFAAIMTMGNLGEHNELLAMKSAGMSLLNILRPLVGVVLVVAVSSFFVVNNLVPYSNKKMMAIIYDIRQQKETMEFKDGIFFNGIENMNIRVGHQNPDTGLLTDILIYDTRDRNGNMTTTVADSGYIHMSDDKKFLMIKLYNGETYETTRNYKWNTENAIRHQIFKVQNGALEIEGFDFSRTDMNLFSNHQTKTTSELQVDIDSLRVEADRGSARSYEPLLKNYLLTHDKSGMGLFDTVKVDYSYKVPTELLMHFDTLSVKQKRDIVQTAKTTARSSRNSLNRNESTAKDTLNKLYRSQVEWHRKVSLPISVIIFFLIGAPLGAIIRKGGLAMPVVVSVLFFVIYYVISIAGEKMAKEGSWNAAFGMWFSAMILLPIALYLTRIATNDSNLFNTDWYVIQFNRAKAKVQAAWSSLRKK